MDREAIKLLNRILPDLPLIDWNNPSGSFRVSDIVEKRKLSHDYDRMIADFLLNAKFATLILSHNIFSNSSESRTLELTEKGAKLHEVGSYENYLGLFKTLILNIFNFDISYRWITMKENKKAWIIGAVWGLVFGVPIGCFFGWLFK